MSKLKIHFYDFGSYPKSHWLRLKNLFCLCLTRLFAPTGPLHVSCEVGPSEFHNFWLVDRVEFPAGSYQGVPCATYERTNSDTRFFEYKDVAHIFGLMGKFTIVRSILSRLGIKQKHPYRGISNCVTSVAHGAMYWPAIHCKTPKQLQAFIEQEVHRGIWKRSS